MRLERAVYLPNCLLVIVSSDRAEIPDYSGELTVEASDTSILVGTEYSGPDEFITVILTDEVDAGQARAAELL